MGVAAQGAEEEVVVMAVVAVLDTGNVRAGVDEFFINNLGGVADKKICFLGVTSNFSAGSRRSKDVGALDFITAFRLITEFANKLELVTMFSLGFTQTCFFCSPPEFG